LGGTRNGKLAQFLNGNFAKRAPVCIPSDQSFDFGTLKGVSMNAASNRALTRMRAIARDICTGQLSRRQRRLPDGSAQ
jgi:hypothetical protein